MKRTVSILALGLAAMLPADLLAHAQGEDYVIFNFHQESIDGLFEIHFDDLRQKLGIVLDGDEESVLQQVEATAPGTQAQGMNEILTGGRMTNKEVEAIQEFIGDGAVSEDVLKQGLGLAMSLPTYQFI